VNRLDQNQVEKLQAISTQLRQAREDQGITLEQLAAKTYIPMRTLRALDAVQVDSLPEPVFIQGFIRRYGDMVHLDGTALAQTFPLETAPPPPPEPIEPESAAEAPSAEKLPRSTWLVGGAIFAIVVLLLGSISLLNRPKTLTPSPQARTTSPQASAKQAQKPTTSSPKSSTQPVTATTQQPAAAVSAAPIEAAVNLTEESWVQVIVDGKTAFEGTLPQGTKKTWTAQKQLTLLAGNAGGVVVAVNRSAAKPLGQAGEVKEVTYTPASLAQSTRL
jgi:cytoskeleton protein RodZ